MAADLLEVLEAGVAGFGDAQAVEGEEADQRVLERAGCCGGGEDAPELVELEAERRRLLGHLGATHRGRRRLGDRPLLDGVAVEAGQHAEPAADRPPGPAELLELAGVQLQVGPASRQRVKADVGAPGQPGPKVAGVGRPGGLVLVGREEAGHERPEVVDGGCRRGELSARVHDGQHAVAPLSYGGQAMDDDAARRKRAEAEIRRRSDVLATTDVRLGRTTEQGEGRGQPDVEEA